ncbi:MAG TPA: LptA/OstA family protein [Oligoflexia bacterium]|nr:LptA/OstA family protein [Oligoflexia bacterium]HMP26378.1 LptA/OstA family protein [Oligoflexia bacterium]
MLLLKLKDKIDWRFFVLPIVAFAGLTFLRTKVACADPSQKGGAIAISVKPSAESASSKTADKNQKDKQTGDSAGGGLFSFSSNPEFDKQPTYVTSDKLNLYSNRRFFEYLGNVVVTKGDLIIHSDILEGTYDENNQVEKLIARSNVRITKGENIKANSQKATFFAHNDTVELTENPQVEQEGSVLNADLVRIFLKDNRSEAEGKVSVKLVEKGAPATPTPEIEPTPIPKPKLLR